MKPQDGDSSAYAAIPARVPAPVPDPVTPPSPSQGAANPAAGPHPALDQLWQVNATLAERLALQQAELDRQRALAVRDGARVAALLLSTSWRLTRPLRAWSSAWARWRQAPERSAAAGSPSPAPGTTPRLGYPEWVSKYDQLDAQDMAALRRQAADPALPFLRLVIVFDAASAANGARVASHLRRQLFERWHAYLVFAPGGASAAVADTRGAASGDARCTVAGAGELLAAAVPFTAGDCLVLCTGDTLLREHALGLLAGAARPGVQLVYADDDGIDAAGQRSAPFFKPDFSRELQRQRPLLGGAVLMSGTAHALAAVVHDVLAGLEASAAPAAVRAVLGSLVARIADTGVAHLPQVLSHRIAGDGAAAALPEPGTAAMSAAASAAVSVAATTSAPDTDGSLPTISIIIPTRDGLAWLATCLASIAQRTVYPAGQMEVIVVDNGSSDPATLAYLDAAQACSRARVLRDPAPFNYARLNNLAARAARGQILVFVNNDTKVDDAHWLLRLAHAAGQADVGAVGGKLLYEDRTVQHAGIVLGLGAVAGHAFVGLAEDDGGYQGLACVTREVAAVTGACLAMRRSVFEQIGGFREELAVAFNDVALCLDALALGYRNLCLGQPLLLHFESKSRGLDDTPEKAAVYAREAGLMREIFGARLLRDPYYNPNLSLTEAYALAAPPRGGKPWRGEAGVRG